MAVKDKLKDTEWIVSLANAVWAVLAYFGIPALVVTMLGTAGVFLYSASEQISQYGAAGWIAAGAIVIIVLAWLTNAVLLVLIRIRDYRARRANTTAAPPATGNDDLNGNATESPSVATSLMAVVEILREERQQSAETLRNGLAEAMGLIVGNRQKIDDYAAASVQHFKDFDSARISIKALSDTVEALKSEQQKSYEAITKRVRAQYALNEIYRLNPKIRRAIAILERVTKYPDEQHDWQLWHKRSVTSRKYSQVRFAGSALPFGRKNLPVRYPERHLPCPRMDFR